MDEKKKDNLDAFFSDELKNKDDSDMASDFGADKGYSFEKREGESDGSYQSDERANGSNENDSNTIGDERTSGGSSSYSSHTQSNSNARMGGYTKDVKKDSKSLLVVLVALLLVLSFVFGVVVSRFFNSTNETDSLYEEVFEFLDGNYLYGFDADNPLGYLLDGYTYILSPYDYYANYMVVDIPTKIFGITYNKSDDLSDGLDIVSVSLNSPMDKAGVLAGDKLTVLNGYNVSGMTIDEVISVFSDNTTITVTVVRNTRNADDVTVPIGAVEKDYVESKYVEYYFRDANGNVITNFNVQTSLAVKGYDANDTSIYPHYDAYGLDLLSENVGFIKLHQFWYTTAESESDDITPSDFKGAMDLFKAAYSGEGKLVLDLTDNGGGYNSYCYAVASYFIYDGLPNENLTVCRLVYADKSETPEDVNSVYADYFDEYSASENIAVLTNGNSASASEMLLGCMLVYKTAVQVGSTTYGKGVSQSIVKLREATTQYNGQTVNSYYALKYTFAFFYTPDLPGRKDYKYNDYCNQMDKDGNGTVSEAEAANGGFRPDEDNTAYDIYDMMDIANKLLTK
ncbi:MAG: S41 family peptidase [Clostridia bacterium]|nr:S41 family peptidase [Clostridia bacterium]